MSRRHDETDHLLSSPANAKHLLDGIARMDADDTRVSNGTSNAATPVERADDEMIIEIPADRRTALDCIDAPICPALCLIVFVWSHSTTSLSADKVGEYQGDGRRARP